MLTKLKNNSEFWEVALKRILLTLIFFSLTYTLFSYYFPFSFNDTRPMGMGNAFTALSDDASALEYNPAGLAYIKSSAVNFDGNWFEYDSRSSLFDSDNNFTIGNGKISYVQKNFGIFLGSGLVGDIKNPVTIWMPSPISGMLVYYFFEAGFCYGLVLGIFAV